MTVYLWWIGEVQWLKWFCEAGGGLTWRSQVGANPIPIPHPTNLALFRHKITLYRFNQRGLILLQGGGLKWEQGLSPPSPITLTTVRSTHYLLTAPVCKLSTLYSKPLDNVTDRLSWYPTRAAATGHSRLTSVLWTSTALYTTNTHHTTQT